MVAPKCNAMHHFQRIGGSPSNLAARNHGLNAGRMHAGGSAGGAARRPAPAESVVDLGPTYTAKPYASWPGPRLTKYR